jgi:transposase
MDQATLVAAALGLQDPWRVVGIHFDEKKRELEITIDLERGARLTCPECQVPCSVHDTKETTWRHLDFFQHKTLLTARHPRTKCLERDVKLVSVPWARSRTGFTFLFEAMALAMVPHMPVAALARHLWEHDTRIWRIVEHYVEAGRRQVDHGDVSTIGVDETSQRKHHEYISGLDAKLCVSG